MDGRALTPADIATLATLPSLDELRGRLVGLLQAPAQKLVTLLVEPGAQLARLVEARRGKLAESEGGAEGFAQSEPETAGGRRPQRTATSQEG